MHVIAVFPAVGERSQNTKAKRPKIRSQQAIFAWAEQQNIPYMFSLTDVRTKEISCLLPSRMLRRRQAKQATAKRLSRPTTAATTMPPVPDNQITTYFYREKTSPCFLWTLILAPCLMPTVWYVQWCNEFASLVAAPARNGRHPSHFR